MFNSVGYAVIRDEESGGVCECSAVSLERVQKLLDTIVWMTAKDGKRDEALKIKEAIEYEGLNAWLKLDEKYNFFWVND